MSFSRSQFEPFPIFGRGLSLLQDIPVLSQADSTLWSGVPRDDLLSMAVWQSTEYDRMRSLNKYEWARLPQLWDSFPIVYHLHTTLEQCSPT